MQRIACETGGCRAPNTILSPNDYDRLTDVLWHAYGIQYLAPCDARMTEVGPKSIDAITSTNTLEHTPAADIRLILRECRRLLKPEGLMSFIVDYQDHYSYCDSSITAFNFLKYSDAAWRIYNPAFHYQNRLRHRDYLELFRVEGFQAVDEEVVPRSENDVAHLEKASVCRRFKNNYGVRESGVRSAQIVPRATP